MRAAIASSFGIAAAIFGFAAALGLSRSTPAAAAAAIVVAALASLFVHTRCLSWIDPGALPRPLKLASAAGSVVALIVLARLTVFMVDPTQIGYSSFPDSRWDTEHSCLSAYYVAARAAGAGEDVYDDALYSVAGTDPSVRRQPLKLGMFNIDVFEYPPPFLLLPRALMPAAPGFVEFRMVWFGLSGAVLLIGSFAVARAMGPVLGTRALLLLPLLWLSLPTLSTFQKGNVQTFVFAGAMLAMVLFHQKRAAAGGLVLAFVTLSKLYPGVLIVYLLIRREWRAIAWTAAFSLLLLALTLADTGVRAFAHFMDHLPRLLSGEAFPAFRNPGAIAINLSVPGIVFKLRLFGVPGMGFPAAKIVGWVYTAVLLAITIASARRAVPHTRLPLVWLALLVLATLRSPFLPQVYGAFPAFWMLTLLIGCTTPSARNTVTVILVWLGLNVYYPQDWPIDPRMLALLNAIPQVLTAAVAIAALRVAAEPLPSRGVTAIAA